MTTGEAAGVNVSIDELESVVPAAGPEEVESDPIKVASVCVVMTVRESVIATAREPVHGLSKLSRSRCAVGKDVCE